jgi:hypothetical protein
VGFFTDVERIVPVNVKATFPPDGSQLVAHISCNGQSDTITFGRDGRSGTPFSGDWINQEFGAALIHIRGVGVGTNEIAASFDQVSFDQAGLGMPFDANMQGGELYLSHRFGPGLNSYFARESGDANLLNGRWSGNHPAGNAFRRLNPAP